MTVYNVAMCPLSGANSHKIPPLLQVSFLHALKCRCPNVILMANHFRILCACMLNSACVRTIVINRSMVGHFSMARIHDHKDQDNHM
jgi:hypothetical protein